MMQIKLFDRIDPFLLGSLMVAISFGMILLISAHHGYFSLAIKQLVRATPAFLAIFFITKFSKRDIIDLTPWIYILSISLLVAVLALGYMTKGAQRWIDLGFFKFEPSELLKITLPMMLGYIISRHGIPIGLRSLASCLTLTGIPFVLVLKQPDLGTALTIAGIGAVTIFLAGLSRKWLVIGMSVLVAFSPIAWHQLHDYQKQRIMTLLHPNDDLQHHGYHIHQSKIAIGSGGLFGRGLMKGEQVQYGFLPEHRTDFIFAMICEELGFLGSTFWILLTIFIGFRGILLGDMQYCIYSKITCISISCNFLINAWINMAMVSGMIPVVGIPLPLISYGGTSFVMNLIGFALILKLGHINPKRQGAW